MTNPLISVGPTDISFNDWVTAACCQSSPASALYVLEKEYSCVYISNNETRTSFVRLERPLKFVPFGRV